MVRLGLRMMLAVVAAVAIGCGDDTGGSGNGDGSGGTGVDLPMTGHFVDLAMFTPHAPWLGLPSATMSTMAHLRAGDIVYASDQMAASAVSLRAMVPGTKAAAILPAGCCATSDVPKYPLELDAVLYDYQPNQGLNCPMDRCQNLPMYCTGGGGLP